MTHRVTAGIYAQAARLRLKGAPFFAHPARQAGAQASAPPVHARIVDGRDRAVTTSFWKRVHGVTATQSAQARTPEGCETAHPATRHAPATAGRAGLSRRIVLAAGQRASGAAIEVTEGGETFQLGRGEPWPG